MESVRIFADGDAQNVISYAGTMIAAVGSLAIGLLLLFSNSFTPVVSNQLVSKLILNCSFYEHYLDFTRGLLNLADLTFFVSITGLFLFLTVRHLERRRIS